MQAFHRLPDDDKAILAEEMARTGIQGQSYSTAPCMGGSAFLVRAPIVSAAYLHSSSHKPRRQPGVVHVQVYYSPAFLRLSNDNLFAALRVLACVYRAARSLFPLSDADSKGTIVYIDRLNAAGPADSLCSAIGVGQLWLLVRTGDREAVVQRYSLLEHIVFEPPKEAYRVLHITTSLLSTA